MREVGFHSYLVTGTLLRTIVCSRVPEQLIKMSPCLMFQICGQGTSLWALPPSWSSLSSLLFGETLPLVSLCEQNPLSQFLNTCFSRAVRKVLHSQYQQVALQQFPPTLVCAAEAVRVHFIRSRGESQEALYPSRPLNARTVGVVGGLLNAWKPKHLLSWHSWTVCPSS